MRLFSRVSSLSAFYSSGLRGFVLTLHEYSSWCDLADRVRSDFYLNIWTDPIELFAGINSLNRYVWYMVRVSICFEHGTFESTLLKRLSDLRNI